MTQQQYYPPQQPQYPQAPPAQYAAPPQQYAAPPAPPAYPQQYAQPYPAPAPQPPAQPLAQGNLDDYYSQPSAGSGPSISWTDKQGSPKPIGTVYAGIVARDVTNADVQQQTDFRTQAPLFYRDGRPKFAMKVPLKVQPSPEFPEGEATWFVKGQARDELVRAMAEAGCEGAPKAGATIVVRLVHRRPSGAGMNPANIVQVQYTPPGVQPGQMAPAPQQAAAPVAEQQYAPPPVKEQQFQQSAPQVQVQPQQYQVPPSSTGSNDAPAVQQYAAPPQQQAPQQPQVPQQGAPQPPSDLSPEQQQLLATLTNR